MSTLERRCGGSVLVELLVGMAVGLAVVAAALAAAVSLLQATALARDALDLEQRADLALRLVGRQLRLAGTVSLEDAAGAVRFSTGFTGWQSTGAAVSGLEGGPGQPDTLRTSYENTSPDDRDCLGFPLKIKEGTPADGAAIDSQFDIAPEPTNGGRPALFCDNSTRPGGRQPVVSYVDDLQLEYWIRGADGATTPVLADELTPATPVLAVAACLQLTSEMRHGAPPALDCQGAPLDSRRQQGRLVRLVRAVFRVRHAG